MIWIDRDTASLLAKIIDTKTSFSLVSGTRGFGKTKIVREALKELGSRKVVWIDLEDPRHAPGPRLETIDLYVKAAKEKPDFLVLDEICAIENWDDLVKINRYPGVKIIAIASGNPEKFSNILGNKIEIFAFGPERFAEYQKKTKSRAEESLIEYLSGGNNGTTSQKYDFFYNILFMDIVRKKEIRDSKILTDMAVYLIESSGSPISAAAFKKHRLGSLDKIRNYLELIEESGMVSLIRRIEDFDRKRNEASRLCFAGNIGWVPLFSRCPVEMQRQALCAVYHELRRFSLPIFAWRVQKNDGLLVKKPGGNSIAVSVFWEEKKSDLGAISKAMDNFGAREGLLLGRSVEDQRAEISSGVVRRLPLWKWLARPSLSAETGDFLPASSENDEISNIPSHLL